MNQWTGEIRLRCAKFTIIDQIPPVLNVRVKMYYDGNFTDTTVANSALVSLFVQIRHIAWLQSQEMVVQPVAFILEHVAKR